MASLMLLKELDSYDKKGEFDIVTFGKEFARVRGDYGVLGNIVVGMLQGIP
jgi:hypothetical protein